MSSDDITARLRSNADEWEASQCPTRAAWDREGADEIERLRAELERAKWGQVRPSNRLDWGNPPTAAEGPTRAEAPDEQ